MDNKAWKNLMRSGLIGLYAAAVTVAYAMSSGGIRAITDFTLYFMLMLMIGVLYGIGDTALDWWFRSRR